MPMHVFRCQNKDCRNIEEDIVKWDTEYIECPKCKSKMYKTLTSFNFQLKGGGWAKDGYTKKK